MRKRIERSEYASTDISQFEIKKGWMEREWEVENLKTSPDTYVFTSFIYFFLKYKKRRDCWRIFQRISIINKLKIKNKK